MKEFILLIYDNGEPMHSMSEEVQQAHIQKVGQFIGGLAQAGHLINAQPFSPSAARVSGTMSNMEQSSFKAGQGDIAGFYHIKANDLAAATEIAQSDPRFEDSTWTIEIREIQSMEGIN